MNLDDQLAWEDECSKRGSIRYADTQAALKAKGRAEQTDIASYLRQEYITDIADKIKEHASHTVGKGAKYNTMIRARIVDNDYNKVAYLALQVVVQACLGDARNTTATSLGISIADRLETDYKCMIFESRHPAYFGKVMESFKSQRVTSYEHQKKVVMVKFGEFEYNWTDWTQEFKAAFGFLVLRGVCDALPDMFQLALARVRTKTEYRVVPAEGFVEWVQQFEHARGLMFPQYLPTKIPPLDWESNTVGGYYSPNIRVRFVKTKGKRHEEIVREADLSRHYDAANKMQRTAWRINKRVLDVQRIVYEQGLGVGIPPAHGEDPEPFPEDLAPIAKEDLTPEQQQRVTDWKHYTKAHHRLENERKARVVGFMQSYRLGLELRDWDEFYYVITADFRGRLYTVTTGLTPQGADVAKGILQFAKGVPLGKQGAQWLAVHGANVYGKDKLPYAERVAWIRDREVLIKAVVDDPISNRELWAEADKPYQFLAFCYDWADTDYGRDQTANSYLPVALDGSCNGLQHYSAMLRDKRGAVATNLCAPSSTNATPEDIYQQVADVTTSLLRQRTEDAHAATWLAVGIARKCAKRPVMTLPYGSTQNSARDYIFDWVRGNWELFQCDDDSMQYTYACYLTPIMWQAIGEVVIAARLAMQWLRKNMPRNAFVSWTTPIGFPVYQYYKELPSIPVDTYLSGRTVLRVRDYNNEAEPQKYAQKSGLAPNFVHSLDATHLVMTVNATDFDSYAMIHDDYGTHAGNTHKMFPAIRETFFDLYKNNDPLAMWADECNVAESKLLGKGFYNIADVKKAVYFYG